MASPRRVRMDRDGWTELHDRQPRSGLLLRPDHDLPDAASATSRAGNGGAAIGCSTAVPGGSGYFFEKQNFLGRDASLVQLADHACAISPVLAWALPSAS